MQMMAFRNPAFCKSKNNFFQITSPKHLMMIKWDETYIFHEMIYLKILIFKENVTISSTSSLENSPPIRLIQTSRVNLSFFNREINNEILKLNFFSEWIRCIFHFFQFQHSTVWFDHFWHGAYKWQDLIVQWLEFSSWQSTFLQYFSVNHF